MTEDQFWWATVHGHDSPEIVEVTFEHGKPRRIDRIGTDIYICAPDFEQCHVRLIERVLPAGRAAAVEALSDAMWQCLDDMGAQGQGVCLASKAKARIAYEPFRVDADGEEAPLD